MLSVDQFALFVNLHSYLVSLLVVLVPLSFFFSVLELTNHLGLAVLVELHYHTGHDVVDVCLEAMFVPVLIVVGTLSVKYTVFELVLVSLCEVRPVSSCVMHASLLRIAEAHFVTLVGVNVVACKLLALVED